MEHGIQEDGRIKPNYYNNFDAFNSFFAENSDGKYVPRSVFIDYDHYTIDKVSKGPYRSLFHPS